MKINHDIVRKSTFIKNLNRWYNQSSIIGYFFNRFQWHYYPRLSYVRNYPIHVDIELSSHCQLNCPMCFRFHRKIENLGNMELKTFKNIIDSISGKVYSIKFTGRGEPLMNKRFPEFMDYLKHSKFGEVAMITNGLLMTDEIMHSVIDNNMDFISFSIDGLKDTYEKIRYPGKYEDIYDIVSRLHQLRTKKGKNKPLIRIQSVNVSIEYEKEYLKRWSPISDDIFFLFYKDYSQNAENIQLDNYTCPLLYQRMMIHYDGTVPMCINDEYEDTIMGNFLENSIQDIWQEKFENARNLNKQGLRLESFENCRKCSLTREGHGKK